jgi:hypothetical protein
MSTFIGKVGSKPICHMTSDTQTQTTLEGDPISTTLFHSQLPYVFAREQFELTSYTTWGGGRTFAFSQALIDFKDANPDLACLLILEDTNGAKTIFNPTPNLRTTVRYPYPAYGMGSIGHEYSCAFTSSDTQLSNISRQGAVGQAQFAYDFTLYTFDAADTRVTVFRHEDVGTYTNTTTPCGQSTRSPGQTYWDGEYTNAWTYYTQSGFHTYINAYNSSIVCPNIYLIGGASATDLQSRKTLDIVKVRFVFLNVTNSASTFERQKDYSGTSSITIKDDEFNVGNIDLIKNAPLIGHGVKNTTDTVTPIIGTLAGGTPAVFTKGVIQDTGKVSSTGVPTENGTPVIEFPDPSTASTTMEYDFLNQVFKRDGKPVFSSTSAAKGLQVLGTAEIQFSMNYTLPSGAEDTFATLGTASISGASASTLYLASCAFADDDVTYDQFFQTCLYSVGSNRIANTLIHMRNSNGSAAFGAAPTWICDIDSSGNITVKIHKRTFGIGGFSGDLPFGSLKLRLIAMDS